MMEISRLLVNIAGGTNAAHAYIIEGRAGEKRDRFVRDIVKGLNCAAENPGDRPCCRCDSCRQIEAGTSMDVFHMARSGKLKYKVREDAEPFIERLGMGAYGRHIIGVIDDADALGETVENKLLKTLEEPEEGAIIILATGNRDNLLDTVRSRCSLIRMADYEEDNEEAEREAALADALDLLFKAGPFCEFRAALDKKLSGSDKKAGVFSAADFLGEVEEECRRRMLEGINRAEMVRCIELTELARMDIAKGMENDMALKRLYLELH